jgi:hypothetical protein
MLKNLLTKLLTDLTIDLLSLESNIDAGGHLILEDGGHLLLEDGGKILLEQ